MTLSDYLQRKYVCAEVHGGLTETCYVVDFLWPTIEMFLLLTCGVFGVEYQQQYGKVQVVS